MDLRHALRRAGNRALRLIPRPVLQAVLKSFETQPEVAEAVGYNVYPRTFYSPFAQLDEIDWDKARAPRELPGVTLDLASAAEVLQRLQAFAGELARYPYRHEPNAPFWFDNQTFTDFDAAVLYTMLRHLKPKRYVELGCGYSSLVSSTALKTNIAEGHRCDAIYADPEPRLDVRPRLEFAQLLIKPVQQVPLDVFRSLNAGDVLFIDTSHVLKFQSDVEFELLHILPELSPGVWIHFHDVFTPYDYPEDWLVRAIRFVGNEQYGVECLLSGGDRYKAELPLFYLWKLQHQALTALLPAGRTRPHSFWIRKQR